MNYSHAHALAGLLCLAGSALAQSLNPFPLNDILLFGPGLPGTQGWGSPRNLDLAAGPGVLSLTVRGPDSSIQRTGLAVDPGMALWLQVRYRASGLPEGETHGELFYANAAHGFADDRYAHLPSLVGDGEWHDLWVHLPAAMRGEPSDWWDGGAVNALRLDLLNGAPARIEVNLIRLTAARDEELVPAGGRCLRRWGEPYALEMEDREGGLALHVRERDCRLQSLDVPLNPAAARFVAIRYRASGFGNQETGGQIFYANSRHGIEAGHRLPIPALVTDGQWHDLVIDAAEALGRGFGDWFFGGPVTALRLDLVDQAPGEIEVAVVLVTPRLRVTSLEQLDLPEGRHFLLPAAAFSVSGAAAAGTGCSVELPDGQFTLWVRLLDVPEAYAALGRVRVEGGRQEPPGAGNSGGLVWARLGTASGGPLRVHRPADAGFLLDAVLITEGDHVPRDRLVPAPQPVASSVRRVVPQSRSVAGPYWGGQMISCPEPGERDARLSASRTLFRRRFEAPGDLETAWLQISVDDFFRLYLNGTLVAENLTAGSWMTPTLLDATAHVRAGRANVIAVEAYNAGGPGGVFFDMVLNRPDHSAVRVVSDESWRCRGKAPDGWAAPEFDDAEWLTPACQPGPPNSPWVVAIPYVNKAWEPPTRVLELQARERLPAGETQEIACRLDSETPVAAGDVLVATLTRADTGGQLMSKEFQLTAEQLAADADGTVALRGLSVPISRWFPAGDVDLALSMPGRRLEGNRLFRFAVYGDRPAENLASEVRMGEGVPRLWVNGRPFFAMVGNGEGRDREGTAAACRAAGFNVSAVWVDGMGRPQWWTGPGQFDFGPVDALLLETLDSNPEALVLPILWAAPPPWWGERYPEELARFSDGTSWPYYRSTPSFNSRRWREDAAEAVGAFVRHIEGGPFAGRVLGYWVVGGVSAEWQGWGCHNSAANRHLMDYSAPEQEAFHAFLRGRFPEHPEWHGAAIPGLAERLERHLGVFRDPARAALCIAYDRMYSESVAGTMLACVGAAKAACGRRKIVGVYYGYSLEYANMDWALHMSGHNALRLALDSPDLDFLSAPHSYAVRRLGEDMGWMWPFASIHRAGKLFWPDDDSRTHLSGACDYNPSVNPAQTREVLRRNWGKQLCHLTPVGFLQIESGRELASPAIARDARITRRAGEFALRQGVRRRAEIAAVIDEESIPYLSYDSARLASDHLEPVVAWNGDQWLYNRRVNNLAAELIGYQRSRLARIGAPVDILLLSDFEKGPLDYKLYIMLSCFRSDERVTAAVREQVLSRGATVLWCGAPGFIRGESAAAGHMQDLTGIELRRAERPFPPMVNVTRLRSPLTAGLLSLTFGAPYELDPVFYVADPAAEVLGVYRDSGLPALALKAVGGGRSLFCGSPVLPPDLLRSLARAAGVHIYLESGDVLHANDGFVMLHTASAGEKTIRLPARADVVEVYTGQVLFRGVDSFRIREAAQTTRVFYLGDADAFLRAMDYGSL